MRKISIIDVRTWYRASGRTHPIVMILSSGVALLLASHAAAQSINLGGIALPPENPTVDENGVDVANGTPAHERLELSIGGDGVGALSLIRYFSGSGFRTNFDNEFVETQSMNLPYLELYASVLLGNSSEAFYNLAPKSPTGSSYEMQGVIPGNYVYRKKDGSYVNFTHNTSYYNESGDYEARSIADSVQYPNGVQWLYNYLDLQYVENGLTAGIHRVQSITSSTGYQLKFYYASDVAPVTPTGLLSWHRATRVVAINNAYEYCSPTASSCPLSLPWPEVQYSASPGYFLTVTDPTGGQTDYKNTGGVRYSGSSSDNRSYTLQQIAVPCVLSDPCWASKVVSANVDGKITEYSYSYNNGIGTTIATGPDSKTNTYRNAYFLELLGGSPRGYIFGPVKEHVNTLYYMSQYEYDRGDSGVSGALTKVTLPDGNYFKYTRDNGGSITETLVHAKASSALPGIKETRVIGPFAQPTSITDPQNNVTTYTYSTTHGGVLTETGPAVNGVAPMKRYDYAQHYAWIKNASDNYVQAESPIWLLDQERTCRTSSTVSGATGAMMGCTAGAGDEVITAYEYEAGDASHGSNLLLRGTVVTAEDADGVIRSYRTCYGYDKYGNKISEISPRAGLTSCP